MVTIKEIARRADLSIGTVDRVLHNRGRVSEETKTKVKLIVAETGYKTNIHARNLSLQATYKFGVVIPKSEKGSGYWKIVKSGICKASEELSTFNVKSKVFEFSRYSSGNDETHDKSFLDAGRDALEYGAAGLVIAPVWVDACRSFIESLSGGSAKKIPYVFIDSTIKDTKPLAFIGQDSFQSGVCGARLMQMVTTGEGNVVVLRMSPDDCHIEERVKGFRSFFEGLHPEKVYECKMGRSKEYEDERAFVSQIKAHLDKVPECKGVFVTNATAHRVVKAMKKCGYNGVKVIGYDCTENNRRLVEKREIDFIISQKPELQGYKAINALFKYLVLKEPCASEETMPIDIIMAENLADYQ